MRWHRDEHACSGPACPTCGESSEFLRGIESVTAIRCVEHRAVRAYNRNESSGGECAACAVESLRAEVERLTAQLKELAASVVVTEVERLRKETRG